MILRAQPIGPPAFQRYVIQNINDDTVWDGVVFVEDWNASMKYVAPTHACLDMQQILKTFYGELPVHRYMVPIEVEVYGSVRKRKIARYLHQASVLNIRTHEYGNGPGECLVLPVIRWGLIKEIKHSVFPDLPLEDEE